jgi:hypothetical protein
MENRFMLEALLIVDAEMSKASSKGPSGRPGVAALNRMWDAARAAIAQFKAEQARKEG